MRIPAIFLFIMVNLGVWTTVSHAHSAKSYTSMLYKDFNGWNLKMNFSSPGFLAALRTYNNDDKMLLDYSHIIKEKIILYFENHVKIIVNKEFEAKLHGYQSMLSDHASEFNFRLSNIPNNPIYLDVLIDACKENAHSVMNLLIIKQGENSKTFSLSKTNGFKVKVMKDSKGRYRELN